MVFYHRGLDRMQFARWPGNAFDGSHSFSVELGEKQNAGVHGTAAAVISNHHGAGATVTFVATFFGPFEAARIPQPVQKGARCGFTPDTYRLSIQKKLNLHSDSPPLSLQSDLRRVCPMRRKAKRTAL